MNIVEKQMPQHLDLFRECFERVFDRPAWEAERPSYLGLIYHQDLIGFISGYAERADTFYMQRIGVFNRGQKYYKDLWDGVADYFRGFQYITAVIRSDNLPPLIVALKTGWRIHGFKVNSGGTQYVQVIKELNNG